VRIDTDRLVTIASELKTLHQRREKLLVELQHMSRGDAGRASVAPSLGRPRLSPVPSQPLPPAGRTPRKGLTSTIVDFLKGSGGAHTAGEIVAGLNLSRSKGRLSTVSTTLVRLAKEGRVRKDKTRGYRAA
jgi:hypothetical protein